MTSDQGLLFVLNSLEVGGSEIKIIKVANALAHSGVHVELAYLNPLETAKGMVDSSVPVTFLDRRGKYSFAALRRLRDLVSGRHQTVVAVNPYPLLYVIPVAKWLGSGGIRAVGLVNSMDFLGRERKFGWLMTRFLRQCDEIVFGCMAQQQHWVRKYGIPADRSSVIYNGVDHDYFSPAIGAEEGRSLRQRLGIAEEAVVIGSIGRLAPEKYYDTLILALARLRATGRDVYAVIAGKGAERGKLEQLARSQGVENRAKFLGAKDDVRPAMSAMDVFVLPSASETFSNAALEAMAMARVVVLSRTGGAPEMVEHGKSGMLFEVGDVDALAETLATLHDSPKLRHTLGNAARERAITSFDPEDMINLYRDLSRPI